jgi:hypothetical protein
VPSNYRVLGTVSGGAMCLLSMGESVAEAIRVARDYAPEVQEALRAVRGRIKSAHVEVYVEKAGQNAFWKRFKNLSLWGAGGLLPDEEVADAA